MGPDPQGRFCNQCHKTVIDFTGLTNQQIIDIVSGGSKVCGLLERRQLLAINDTLNRGAVKTTPNIWKRMAIAATVIWSLSFLKSEAQSKPATMQSPAIQSDIKPVSTPNDTVTYRTITGKIIIDKTKLPLVGAVIRVGNIATASNLTGDFKIRVPLATKNITISAIGYRTKMIQIDQKSDYQVVVADDLNVIGEVDITKYPPKPANK
jgi:hypothetical protein